MPAVEPLVVPSPTNVLSPDAPPALLPPLLPPPMPPRLGIPHSLAPGRDGAELASIVEIGGGEGGPGGTGGDDGGV
jgi:hypothetical protein